MLICKHFCTVFIYTQMFSYWYRDLETFLNRRAEQWICLIMFWEFNSILFPSSFLSQHNSLSSLIFVLKLNCISNIILVSICQSKCRVQIFTSQSSGRFYLINYSKATQEFCDKSFACSFDHICLQEELGGLFIYCGKILHQHLLPQQTPWVLLAFSSDYPLAPHSKI